MTFGEFVYWLLGSVVAILDGTEQD